MIRMIQSSSAGHAKAYFADALSKADYYLEDQELNGRIQGKLAERLGVDGIATKETFFAFCENVNPKTGKPLTPRTKDERTTGYDINFHCPKSVSIVHALSQDDHVLAAFQDSVSETMRDIEADSKTRVRKGGKYDDRETGELAWADFIHQTARPTEDRAPDPHLHAHCFVFNATWDETEKQFKAGQFRDIKRDMPYYQARFQKRLADKLQELGYQVRRTDKSFELEGVPQQVVELFSKRTDEIGRVAKEKGITDAKELGELGARTRAKKQKGMSMADLKTEWRRQIKQLEAEGKAQGGILRHAPVKERPALEPETCVDYAVRHGFERASVLSERRLLEMAYRHGLGNASVSIDAITQSFRSDGRIIPVKEKSRTLCTTKGVLLEEQRMVQLARQGQGKLVPLYRSAPAVKLKEQQAEAVRHVLTTPHQVSIIRGAAGTGKTKLMQEAVSWMEKAGKQVMVVAPTAHASRGVLREEGYTEAETVAKLLTDEKMQEKLKGQVLWVDEAGLLGTQDMVKLLDLVTKQKARLVLGGDTRQHASVVRGDALRILNTVAGIRAAEVSKIYRQKDNAQYRTAVEHLSKGQVREGFDQLDRMGAITTTSPDQPNEALVADYVAAVKKGKDVLVVSPTHAQGAQVTAAIRDRLRKARLLGKKEVKAKQLTNLSLTDAQKADWRSLSVGQVVQFNQNVPGIKRGSVWTIDDAADTGVQLKNQDGRQVKLPMQKSNSYDVFEAGTIGLSIGDTVRITRNGFDKQEKRLDNGQTLKVISVRKNGKLVLRHPDSKARYELPHDYGHIAHAHCVTSYAAQGRTVQEVFISQPAATFPATDAKQFYVSVSRAKERVSIYTDDKEMLLEHAAELGQRQSALELVASPQRNPAMEIAQQRIREELQRGPQQPKHARDRHPQRPTFDLEL
jgi:conjugative relaxase-like TrwC/TraI family protein